MKEKIARAWLYGCGVCVLGFIIYKLFEIVGWWGFVFLGITAMTLWSLDKMDI